MEDEYLFVCEEDLLPLVKGNIGAEIKKEIDDYESNKNKEEELGKELDFVKEMLDSNKNRLDSYNHNYMEVASKKKFNFFEKYFLKRKEYKDYLEKEKAHEREEEEKKEIRQEIDRLQGELERLENESTELKAIVEGFDYKELYRRYEQCKNAKSIEDLEISTEDAIEMVGSEGTKIFVGRSIEELEEFKGNITINKISDYRIGINALRECINQGFKTTSWNYDFLNGHIDGLDEEVDKEISKYPEEYQKKLKEISGKIGKLPLFVDMKSGLFDENTLKKFDVTSIARLYKYSYLAYNDNVYEGMNKISSKKAIDFEELFKEENLNGFLAIYKDILGNDTSPVDVVKFNKIAKLYLNKKEIFDEAIHDPKLIPNIKICCLAQEQSFLDDIDTIDDLRNIKEKIKEKALKDSIGYSDGTISIISSVFGVNPEEIYNTLNLISVSNLEKLSKIIDGNEKDEETIGDIIMLRKFVAKLQSTKNLDNNDNNIKQLVDSLFDIPEEDLVTLYETFGNLRNSLTRVYGDELVGSLDNSNQLIKDIDNGKEDLKSEVQRDYDGSGTDYYILRDKATFIQHVMNAYERNFESATLDIFSDEVNIMCGSPFFSTSSLNNTSQKYLDSTKRVGQGNKDIDSEDYGIDSPNKVTLLFSEMNPNSLVCFGSGDCGIQVQRNRLEGISSYSNGFMGSFSFDTVDDTIKDCIANKNDTTEYVFLFEDKDGKKIRPSAVRVMGEEPSQYEIEAAQILNAPLVKLELAIEKEKDNINSKEKKDKPSEEIVRIFNKLEQNLSDAIEMMPDKSKDNDTIDK